jgi:hypothetical protein
METPDAKSQAASEYLKFKALIEYSTYPDERKRLSVSLAQVSHPQGISVMDAMQRVARRMWRP